MALDKTKLVYAGPGKTGAVISLARSTGALGSPGAFSELCLVTSFSMPYGWTTANTDDGTATALCVEDTDNYNAVNLDKLAMETTLNMLYSPGDAFQISMLADIRSKEDFYLRIVFTDTQVAPENETFEFKGKIPDYPIVAAFDGKAATLSSRFIATDELPVGGWPIV